MAGCRIIWAGGISVYNVDDPALIFFLAAPLPPCYLQSQRESGSGLRRSVSRLLKWAE